MLYSSPKLNYFNNNYFTGQQNEISENHQESAKAIVITGKCYNKNYQYLLDEKRWIKLNKFPQTVGWIRGMFEINNVFYVVGEKGISTLNNDFVKFPTNKEYNWCATCRVGNSILVVRYYDGVDGESKLFNPINKQWSDIRIKRRDFDVVYYLNKVYIVGGGCGRQVFNSIIIFDPVTNSQVSSPIKMIQARKRHKVIVYKKKLFVFGGRGYEGQLNSVEMFSPETNKFVKMTTMTIARSDCACCRVGNLVYVVGGINSGGGNTKSVLIYNLDSNTWTYGVDLPVAEWNLYACAVNNKLK